MLAAASKVRQIWSRDDRDCSRTTQDRGMPTVCRVPPSSSLCGSRSRVGEAGWGSCVTCCNYERSRPRPPSVRQPRQLQPNGGANFA